MNRLLTKQKLRLLIARIFAGVMLFVWCGSSLPTLIAMTRQVPSCQMSCCKDWQHPANDASGGQNCPMMSKTPDSHEAMPGMDEESPDEITADKYKNILFVAPGNEFQHSAIEEQSGFDDNHIVPLLQAAMSEDCPSAACIANSGSNSGQRQQQSSDNCVLLSFAAHPRPPTFLVTSEIGSQVSFNFKQHIWLRQIPSRGPPVFFS